MKADLMGSRILIENASPKNEAVLITGSTSDRSKSDKNMLF